MYGLSSMLAVLKLHPVGDVGLRSLGDLHAGLQVTRSSGTSDGLDIPSLITQAVVKHMKFKYLVSNI